nr:transposase [Sorangium cellulosum]
MARSVVTRTTELAAELIALLAERQRRHGALAVGRDQRLQPGRHRQGDDHRRALVLGGALQAGAPGRGARLPGHTKDDVLVSTDVTMAPKDIIEHYAKRWSLETTFQEPKGKLGFEQPRSRTERAVERTAPFTLLLYTLVVLWHARSGCTLRSAQPIKAPWYSPKSSPSKTLPAFSDMLATLRRASWAERLFEPDANAPTLKKRLAPLLACLDTAA